MSNILRKFVLGQSPQQLWFLVMLFNVFLIAFVFSNIESGKIGLGIAFALYGLGIVGSRFYGNYFQIWTACQYYLLFYIGALIRKKRQKLFLKIPSLVLLTFEIVLFALYEFIRVKSGVAFKMTTSLLLVCLHVYGAMCAFVILDRVANRIEYRQWKVFQLFLRYNFCIYIVHQQIIYCVINTLNGVISPYILACLCFLAAITLSVMIAKIIDSNKYTRYVFGLK